MSGSQITASDIDKPESLAQQRREWLMERAGWVVIGLTLAAAMLGGLGPGILGRREVTSADGSLRIKYFAIERYEAPCELEIELLRPDEQVGAELVISRLLAERTTLEQIVPPPTSIVTQGDKLVLSFPVDAVAGSEKLIYRYKHDHYGLMRYEVGLRGKEPVIVQQLVLP
jgi:hypothetical protein